MTKLSKLQKFAAIRTFPNVYSSKGHNTPLVVDYQGNDVDMKGQWQNHFQNDNPIILEVACGKGHYARGLGKMYPENNYIGVEIKGNRLWTGANGALLNKEENVAFLRARIEFMEYYFALGEVSEIWITFPDPQLGKARKRTTAPRFLDVYRHILKKDNNRVHLKTDSPELYEYTLEVLEEQQIEILYQNDNIYAQELDFPELDIKTFYEEMHLKDNRTIKYIQFTL
ncbi:tRNA (guanosine(46)-N7)-methyltransferase TrmB [Aureispira sp. CCB-E]|uniref:tRNA (guanosine(46)-N7)-methyltransferase TrmB n=1 Tax=Aureispira sp. CCB-E TaxID=3051121 RepID=UPI0028688D03|nr:tRNA (guanosine(46)-N7)-methyltransferase TrmB [Aureispira sp. CCB-E]WMX15105.1 tRNA (guanosine(46)-N7)-methyltransferase TrmB [Aureispira sp. CCB-E]